VINDSYNEASNDKIDEETIKLENSNKWYTDAKAKQDKIDKDKADALVS
jgi:hypothetical protein